MNKQPAMLLREGIKVLFVHAPPLVMYKWLHESDMSSYFSLFQTSQPTLQFFRSTSLISQQTLCEEITFRS